jgi:hypothetical protein
MFSFKSIGATALQWLAVSPAFSNAGCDQVQQYMNWLSNLA